MTTQTVLIVEDEDNVTPLEIALTTLEGVKVVVLQNGRDAIDFLRISSMKVDALVTDLHLPHIDGFELIKAIRSDQRYSRLPVIVVSGDPRPEVHEELRSLGADAFFAKPYSPAEVRNTLKGLLDAA